MASIEGNPVASYIFRGKDQAVTMDTKSTIKIQDEYVHVDPQLLFQGLLTLGTKNGKLQNVFNHKIDLPLSPALFESVNTIQPTTQSSLVDALCCSEAEILPGPSETVQYVLDGEQYSAYIIRKYGRTIVVFDGYSDNPRFQRLPPARGGTAQRKIFHLANRSQLIHPGPSSSRSRFFMESSQLYAATLTHYSTEPLTTGPDYDPLHLLLALAGDVHPNPGPSRYPCSVCFKNVTSQGTSYLCTRCSHWVHSRCSGLRNAADYRKANGWICTACMTPPRPRTPSPPPSPAHMPTMSDKTFNILQWNANTVFYS